MAPSPTIRRLLKETSELSPSGTNPNPTFHAAPLSDSDLHEWHFTLTGPPAPSPYASGLYHGRISLPPSYPLKPPNFRFLTPSGRFETNREICLSISGFHEETWMPAWGVRTALTALRSFMAEAGTAGQVGGMETSKSVREQLARESRAWRCKQCGGRSNEEVMREWWEVCKERRVKVEEEMSLEALPEGLNLEARDVGRKDEKEEGSIGENSWEEDEKAQVGTPGTVAVTNTPQPIPEQQIPEQPQPPPTPSTAAAPPPQPQPQSKPQPTPPSRSTTTPPPPAPPQTPAGVPAPAPAPAPTAPPTITHPVRTRRPDIADDMGTIDKAIGMLVVALMIMILKKIFFPSGGAGGMEDRPWSD